MKSWVKKIADQFELDWGANGKGGHEALEMSEERATLLYILDIYSKNLFDVEKQPVRKVRETLDQFVKELLDPKSGPTDKLTFRLRQFFSQYRVDEYAYIQKTFEDFKSIIWDFAHQLGEDIEDERAVANQLKGNLDQLREAVESNSIDELRTKSRQFIDLYIRHQSAKDERRLARMGTIRKSLNSVKKQLLEANESMRLDHMTGAHNRKSFEEQLKKHLSLSQINQTQVQLLFLDIDHFKKINDSYGHDIGDFVIKECVRLIKQSFHREEDLVARIGGEEFAVIVPDQSLEDVKKRCEVLLDIVRKEVFVQDSAQIRFTLSMGLASPQKGDSPEAWIKRSDEALYASKNGGRNRLTIAGQQLKVVS